MRVYIISESPISEDELYHHGILGQKWGIRRFQNLDRTWTDEGKIRYGSKGARNAVAKAGKAVGGAVAKTGKAVGGAVAKTGKAVGSLGKRGVQHVTDRIVSKHPWLVSEENLAERSERAARESRYRDQFSRNYPMSRGRKVVGDILEGGAKTLTTKAFNTLASKLFDKKDPAVRELEDVLNDPFATGKEIEAALKKHTAANIYRTNTGKDRKYDVNNLPDPTKMTTRELENYNKWYETLSTSLSTVYGENATPSSVSGGRVPRTVTTFSGRSSDFNIGSSSGSSGGSTSSSSSGSSGGSTSSTSSSSSSGSSSSEMARSAAILAELERAYDESMFDT